MPEMSESAVMLLGRYQNLGTPEEIASKRSSLEEDNRKQRDEIRDYKEQAKKLPKEGERVLSVDEVKRWDAFAALGKTPEELTQLTTDHEALKVKDVARTREDSARTAVKAEGWSDEAAGVLLRLKDVEGATYSKKKVKEKDAKGADVEVERGFITLPGEGQQPQRLTEFATTNLSDVASLLTGSGGGGGGGGGAGRSERGISYPPQRSGTGVPPVTEPAKDPLERKRAEPVYQSI
jgi:hypothetical protein